MKYLFYLLNEYSIPVINPLVFYLQEKRSADEYKFFVSQKLRNKIPKNWGVEHQLNSLKEARGFNPNFVISPENYTDFRIPGLKVQIFHGVGVEKKSHFVIRHFYDIYLTSGPFVTSRYNELAEQHGYFKIIETGWPKFDHILSYKPNKDFALKGINPNQKIILYAPTFSRRMQSANALAETVLQQINENEIWLIKFHELMSPEITAQFEEAENPRFRIIRDGDITPYLHLADIMISDTSSVIYEFSCLGKPVITYRTIANPDKGININQPEELRETLDLLIENPDFQKEKRTKALMQVNPYLDGKISERVFDSLENIEKNGFKTKKTKPMNLFRKAKIFYGDY